MVSAIRRALLGFGLLTLGAMPASSGIPISVSSGKPGAAMDEKAMNEAMQNAFICVASVMAYQFADAEAVCGRVVVAVPDQALGYKFRGLAYLVEHKFEKAEEDFHTAVRLDPSDPENHAGYGQSMSGQGRYAQAIPHFETAIRMMPDDIRYLAASCWARAGDGGRLDLALKDCNRALQISPQFVTAQQNRGLVRLKQKQWRSAIRDYSAALAQDGDRPTALFGRGFAYLQIGETAKARIDVQMARKVDPEIDELYILLGVLPAACHDATRPCPLPDDLRRPSPTQSSMQTVSQQFSQRHNPSGFEELDEMIRSIELGRLDAMLDRTAALPGVTLAPAFSIGWQNAEFKQARRHLSEVRLEYRRQQQLACNRKLIGNGLCRTPTYGTAIPFIEDTATLRREIDRTVDLVQPFWHAVCLASHELTEPCEIE